MVIPAQRVALNLLPMKSGTKIANTSAVQENFITIVFVIPAFILAFTVRAKLFTREPSRPNFSPKFPVSLCNKV